MFYRDDTSQAINNTPPPTTPQEVTKLSSKHLSPVKSKALMIPNRLPLPHMEHKAENLLSPSCFQSSNQICSIQACLVSEPRLDFPPPFSR